MTLVSPGTLRGTVSSGKTHKWATTFVSQHSKYGYCSKHGYHQQVKQLEAFSFNISYLLEFMQTKERFFW